MEELAVLERSVDDVAVALGDALESREHPDAGQACSLAVQRARAAQAAALRACDALELTAAALAASASQQQQRQQQQQASETTRGEREAALAASADVLRARIAAGGRVVDR